jgi:hypothetical protein
MSAEHELSEEFIIFFVDAVSNSAPFLQMIIADGRG